MQEIKGGCQCGYVRYTVVDEPIRLNVCHCTDCQKQSGSAFGMSLVIKPESLLIESGELQEFQVKADSGREKTCGFCPKCGVRIVNRSSVLCSIKAGTLDNTRDLKPDAHYWNASKQGWVSLPDEIPGYDSNR